MCSWLMSHIIENKKKDESLREESAWLKAQNSFIHSFTQKVFIEHLLSPGQEVMTKSDKVCNLIVILEGRQAEDVNE